MPAPTTVRCSVHFQPALGAAAKARSSQRATAWSNLCSAVLCHVCPPSLSSTILPRRTGSDLQWNLGSAWSWGHLQDVPGSSDTAGASPAPEPDVDSARRGAMLGAAYARQRVPKRSRAAALLDGDSAGATPPPASSACCAPRRVSTNICQGHIVHIIQRNSGAQ
jgi:hypothetical protein